MPVEIIGKGEHSPGEHFKDCIEAGEAQGKTLVAVVQFFDETCVVWAAKPKRETRSQS